MTDEDVNDAEQIRNWASEVNNPLRLEANEYCAALTFSHVQRLDRMGIKTARAIERGVLGVARGICERNGTWAPDEGGLPLLTLSAVECGVFIDIAALDPRNPIKWWTRKGDAWALGFDAIGEAGGSWDAKAEPLELHETPLDWLRAGMVGACVLKWTDTALAAVRNCPFVRVASPEHARALRLKLSKPPRLPEILTRGGAQRAA